MNGWTAIYVTTDAGNIIGYIEELPGAMAQGDTLEETEVNLREALEMMLRANRRTTWEDFKGSACRQARTAQLWWVIRGQLQPRWPTTMVVANLS